MCRIEKCSRWAKFQFCWPVACDLSFCTHILGDDSELFRRWIARTWECTVLSDFAWTMAAIISLFQYFPLVCNTRIIQLSFLFLCRSPSLLVLASLPHFLTRTPMTVREILHQRGQKRSHMLPQYSCGIQLQWRVGRKKAYGPGLLRVFPSVELLCVSLSLHPPFGAWKEFGPVSLSSGVPAHEKGSSRVWQERARCNFSRSGEPQISGSN